MDEIKLQNELREQLLKQMDWMQWTPEDTFILEEIDRVMVQSEKMRWLSAEQRMRLKKQLFHSLRRYDVISDALEDPEIGEIMVNGPDCIFVERNGRLEPYGKSFSSEEALRDMIQTIVSGVNRRVNETSPIVDARLPNGSRVNIVLPPVALDGPTMTIRKFSQGKLSIRHMIDLGSVSEEAAHFLEVLVKARYNIFISGGTGSGKTTLLNALSGFIPRDQRIITIEDSAELQLEQIPNLVRLETRNASVDGQGIITVRDLMKSALRMRPDRLIVGEVRGPEVIDMLQAMNTGHDGSLSTGHANSSYDMLNRLETMVLMGMDIPLAAVRAQIASAIDIVIQIARLRDGSRKILSIEEILGIKGGQIMLQPLFRFEETRERNGVIEGQFKKQDNELVHREKLHFAGLK